MNFYKLRKKYSAKQRPDSTAEKNIDGILMPLFGVPVYIPPEKYFPLANMQRLVKRICAMQERIMHSQEKLLSLQREYLQTAAKARFFIGPEEGISPGNETGYEPLSPPFSRLR